MYIRHPRNRQVYERLSKKYVCSSCFDDYAIKQFISSHLKSYSCTYCGKSSSQLLSASFIDVLEFIMKGILIEWVINTPEVEWDALNLNWHGGRTNPVNADYVIHCVLPEITSAKSEILQDFVTAMPHEWRHRQHYDPSPEDFFWYRWDEFADSVKYRTRYIYYRVNTGWQQDIDNIKKSSHFKTRPQDVMEEFSDAISALNIVRTIPPKTTIWRARAHEQSKVLTSSEELGPPPPYQALRSTRMSPAGIPVFYGSLDRETAIVETVYPEKASESSRVMTIGQWETLERLNLLDLADIPARPSLFDIDNTKLRYAVSFLSSFSEIISLPIAKDKHEHIDYVPTQVFTEYIKYLYKDQGGNRVDGILYRSALKRTSKKPYINCVLFVTKDECVDPATPTVASKSQVKYKMLLKKTERISKLQALDFLPSQDIPKLL